MKLPNIFEHEIAPETFAAGQLIFNEGDAGDVMYLVEEGEVDLIIHDRVVETVGPEEFFGEMTLIDHKTRSATARARTACRLAPVSQKRFLFMVQETPFFAVRVLQVMSTRLRRQDAKI